MSAPDAPDRAELAPTNESTVEFDAITRLEELTRDVTEHRVAIDAALRRLTVDGLDGDPADAPRPLREGRAGRQTESPG